MSLGFRIRDKQGRTHLYLIEGAGVYMAIAAVVLFVGLLVLESFLGM